VLEVLLPAEHQASTGSLYVSSAAAERFIWPTHDGFLQYSAECMVILLQSEVQPTRTLGEPISSPGKGAVDANHLCYDTTPLYRPTAANSQYHGCTCKWHAFRGLYGLELPKLMFYFVLLLIKPKTIGNETKLNATPQFSHHPEIERIYPKICFTVSLTNR